MKTQTHDTTVNYIMNYKNFQSYILDSMEQQFLGNLLQGQNVYHCGHLGHNFRTFDDAVTTYGKYYYALGPDPVSVPC